MGEKKKRQFGDRKDGKLVRNLDGMHTIVPYMYTNRTDNEAFIMEEIDISSINNYVEKKNNEIKAKVESGELPSTALDDPYKMFQIILAAVVKTITLRPLLNRFICDRKTYQREGVSVSFVVKKRFADSSAEGLAYKMFGPETTIDTIHEKIVKEINFCRSETALDNSSDFLDKFAKMPHFLLKFVFLIIRFLDRKGWMPEALIKTDPSYATAFITNLGSIKLRSGYHHLNNWGTNSFFVIIGEKKKKPVFDEDGNVQVKEFVNIGLTIDERIADGYYFSKSIAIFKKLLAEPELLEKRADEPISL